MPQYAIIEAPSILGLRPTGVENLPAALLAVGLADRLKARRAGRVEAPAYSPQRDRETRMLNPCGIAAYSVALANAVSDVLDRGEFPLVLGGDCSILIGNLLALRRRPGRYGLLFLDGHTDFYQPEAEPNGEAASMDLALATGRGPTVVTNLEGLRPLVRDEDVVAFAFRDGEQAAEYGSQLATAEPAHNRSFRGAPCRRRGRRARRSGSPDSRRWTERLLGPPRRGRAR
jgi:arginase